MMTKMDVYALWADQAESDWNSAEFLLSSTEHTFYNETCFHFQQCAEKYIKAEMCRLSIPLQKTHDLGELTELLPSDKRPPVTEKELESLSEHAVNSRYPGMGEDLTRQDVSDAQRIAGKIREFFQRSGGEPSNDRS